MSENDKPTQHQEAESNAETQAPRGTIEEAIIACFEEIESMLQRGVASSIRWGLPSLDALTEGIHPKELLVIGGRPSTGKSSLLMQVIDNSTTSQGKRILLFSLDSHRTRFVRRWLSRDARLDSARIRSILLTQDDVQALTAAANKIHSRSDVIIDDTPRPTIDYILNRARSVHAQYGLALLAVDFVQLIETSPGRETREQEVSIIARSLKGLAHELEIPVVVISQLNRLSTGRESSHGTPRKPVTWDLRDSGALEDAADTVLLLHRPELYDQYKDKGIIEINVAKQRNGPRNTVCVRFVEEICFFADLPESTQGSENE